MRFFNLAILLLCCSRAVAGGLDLHALWDDRCAECHGHSADFARQFLRVEEGQLQGRHHKQDLRLFISNHYTPASEVDGIYNMLLAQARIPPRFATECANCHGSAATFVRASLVLDDGNLLGRGSGRRVSDFMQSHRGLTPEDRDFFIRLLERVASEVYRP